MILTGIFEDKVEWNRDLLRILQNVYEAGLMKNLLVIDLVNDYSPWIEIWGIFNKVLKLFNCICDIFEVTNFWFKKFRFRMLIKFWINFPFLDQVLQSFLRSQHCKHIWRCYHEGLRLFCWLCNVVRFIYYNDWIL